MYSTFRSMSLVLVMLVLLRLGSFLRISSNFSVVEVRVVSEDLIKFVPVRVFD